MADLVLVNTPLRDYGRSAKLSKQTLPVLGLAYIATYAARAGFKVQLIDAEALGLGVAATQGRVNELKPKWVGLNLLAPTYRHSVDILSGLDPAIKVMLGGHQAKALPAQILNNLEIPRLDALILGEAETRVAAILADESQVERLPNVYTRGGRAVDGLQERGAGNAHWLAPPIDDLPFVDRRFLPNDPFLAEDGRWEANIVGSRGCPFDCSFCGAAISANPDITIRMRSIGNILDELEMLRREHDCSAFRFVDDLFLANPKLIERSVEGFLAAEIHGEFVWDATGRINILDKMSGELIEAMKRSGCREVALGIESGSDRLLKYIDKKLTRDQIKRVVGRLLTAGINVKGYFILGFPTETKGEFDQTMSLINELWQTPGPGTFRCSVFEFRPYPGTPEWHRLTTKLGYSADVLLNYEHAEIEAGDQRDQFNFSSGLQFGEVPLSTVRSQVARIMARQRDISGSSA